MASQSGGDPRQHVPSTMRNRDAILAVLPTHLPAAGRVLEIASGSGEHAAYFTPRLSDQVIWFPSDRDPVALPGIDAHASASRCCRIAPACRIDVCDSVWDVPAPVDAMFCANMIHITPWEATLGLLRGAGRHLPSGGPLIFYGPFRRDGAHTAASNADFDQSLRQLDPAWGVRDLEQEVLPAAEEVGLTLDAIETMPANNFMVVLRKCEQT